jgi:lipopolysaccharide transport system permease protein
MHLIIEPGLASANYWRDLWRYRELMYFLAWRDIAVRYKQTVIGVAWAILRPALTMLAFVGFRRLVGIGGTGVPDAVLVFAAVLPWQYVSTAVTESSASLLGNANLISKVYFPRLMVPFAAVTTAFADFVITLALLALLMAWYQVPPTAALLALPLFTLLATVLSFGVGLFLAALNVKYRDFRYVVPFIVQVGLFVSPIAFTTADVPERWQALYFLNPMVGIIDGFRWSILGARSPLAIESVLTAAAVAIAVLAVGIVYFRRTERGFADVI